MGSGVNLFDVRSKLAAVLAAPDGEWQVYGDLVDAIDVPCLMLLWNAEKFDPLTSCSGTANVDVLSVAGRVEPGTTLDVLDNLEAEVWRRLRDDTEQWGVRSWSGPRVFEVAKVNYIASRIGLRVAVTL